MDYELFRNFGFHRIDKKKIANRLMRNDLKKTNRILKYKNAEELFKTVDRRYFELQKQKYGWCFLVKANDGNYYAIGQDNGGAFGGELNPYYIPETAIITNPYIKTKTNYRIGEDCFLFRNDTMFQGLTPILEMHNFLLTENFISLRLATINTRIISILNAANDEQKQSAETFLKKIISGELGVIMSNKGILEDDGTEILNYSGNATTGNIKNLIEYEQYIKASKYNEIGLNANYNMKRERITEGEAALNDEALEPMIDDMLECALEDWKVFNVATGYNIEVSLSDAWEDPEDDEKEDPENIKEMEDPENETE